jgi:hypothetical protein
MRSRERRGNSRCRKILIRGDKKERGRRDIGWKEKREGREEDVMECRRIRKKEK